MPEGGDGAIANTTRRYPVLIHVPKTDGAHIELGFWFSKKLAVGENMFSSSSPSSSPEVKKEPAYRTVAQSTPECPRWHLPPSDFVHVRTA